MSLIFEPTTEQQIRALSRHLPQALLLTGADGAGLLSTAKYLTGSTLAEIIQPTDKDGQAAANGIIRIDQIRQLRQYTRGITNNQAVYIIDNADKMNHQTQNAFLKLLEEPSRNVHFILTSHQPNLLLPTITSRTERIAIRPISDEASRLLLAKYKQLDTTTIAQILFLASGRPALISRLANNPSELANIGVTIKDAQALVSGKRRDRLAVIARYTDREQALALLRYSILLAQSANTRRSTRAAITKLARLTEAYERIAANGNIKLQLTALLV